MRSLLLLVLLVFMINASLSAQVVINEIQAVPFAGEPEWIELYNISTTSVTLQTLRISDFAGNSVTTAQLRLSANGYAILTRDTASLLARRKIPHEAVLVQLRQLPALNNDSDAVVLRSAEKLIDSAFYATRWGRFGVSLERIDVLTPALSSANFAASQAADGATPGRLNSIALLDVDARMVSITLNPDLSLAVTVENVGRQRLASVEISLYLDANGNALAEPTELVLRKPLQNLTPSERHTVLTTVQSLQHGAAFCIAIAQTQGDKRNDNDTLRTQVFVPYPRGTMLVNEIMFEPLSGNAEWIELYNNSTSQHPLNLASWFVVDGRPDTVRFSTQDFIVPMGGYAVIAFDSAFFRQYPLLKGASNVFCVNAPQFQLNNDADNIRLCEPSGFVQDSLEYSTKWHSNELASTRGRSIEKIAPLLPSVLGSSWASCGAPEGSTPTRVNSAALSIAPAGYVVVEPNPFNRSRAEVCEIHYSLPYKQARLFAKIFDTSGVPVVEVANNQFSASEGTLRWDGRANSRLLPQGAYILLFEAVDILTGQSFSQKILLVLASS